MTADPVLLASRACASRSRARAASSRRSTASPSRVGPRRGRRHRRRVGLRQVDAGARRSCASCRSRGGSSRGRVALAGRDLLGLSEREMRRVRGSEIGMIFQDPSASLNPVMRIGRQIEETIEAHRRCARRRGTAARHRHAARRAHPRAGGAGARLSAPVFGRHAPARRHRHRHGEPAVSPHRRRADDGARRHRAGADHGPPARDERGDGHRHHPHHPQHRAGLALLLARPRHVCRAHRRVGPDGRSLRQAEPSLYRGAAARGAARRGAGARRPRGDRGKAARSRAQAPGLRLSSALHAAGRHLHP